MTLSRSDANILAAAPMRKLADPGRAVAEAANEQVTPESTMLRGQPAILVTCQIQVGIPV